MNTVSPTNMKISLISIPLACVVISSCQYRPKNFYANKNPNGNIPQDVTGYTSQPDSSYTPYYDGSGINYIHRQGTTSGAWEPTSGNFILNNGYTIEMGKDEGAVKVIAGVDNLEIIEITLTNLHGGRDYSFNPAEVTDGGQTKKIQKGSYRINFRNRWETHASSRPSGNVTVTW